MKYEVSGIEPRQYETEIAGGDSHSIEDYTTKTKAFSLAKKESKKSKWYEVQVRGYDNDGELCGHWYFKNGILTTDMCI